MSAESTILFRARVSADRLRRVEQILSRLGLKPSDALNMLLAQIEIREALPFEVTTHPTTLLTPEQQGEEWNKAFGPY